MISELSRAQEVGVSVLTGFLGAPIAAWTYWTLFHEPICEPDVFSGSRECVVTASGESMSWLALAVTPAAVILGFILAGVAYIVLELLIAAAKRSEKSQ